MENSAIIVTIGEALFNKESYEESLSDKQINLFKFIIEDLEKGVNSEILKTFRHCESLGLIDDDSHSTDLNALFEYVRYEMSDTEAEEELV